MKRLLLLALLLSPAPAGAYSIVWGDVTSGFASARIGTLVDTAHWPNDPDAEVSTGDAWAYAAIVGPSMRMETRGVSLASVTTYRTIRIEDASGWVDAVIYWDIQMSSPYTSAFVEVEGLGYIEGHGSGNIPLRARLQAGREYQVQAAIYTNTHGIATATMRPSSPVPEPASLLLLGLGLIPLLRRRCRR